LRQVENPLHCYPCSVGLFLRANSFESRISGQESESGQNPIRQSCWPKRFFPVIPIMRLILGTGLLFLALHLYVDVGTKFSSRIGVACLALGVILLLAPVRWEILCGCDPHEHAEYGQTSQYHPNRIADSPDDNLKQPSVSLRRTPTKQPSLLHPIV
jgi:hypothetical protein